MFKSNYVLDTYEKITAAIHNQSPVIVYQEGKILDYGGVIESHTKDSITINGAKYLKIVSEFRIR